MNAARVELIHQLVSRAVVEGLPNNEIRNLISSFAHGPDERREGLDYLALLRTRRGEDLNIFSGESNLSDSFRSRPQSANDNETPAPVQDSAAIERISGGYRAHDIIRAAASVRERRGEPPTQTEVAAELGISDRTLRRRMKDLGMGRWPLPYSED